MGYIQLDIVNFSPTPATNQIVTVEYKIHTDSTYILFSNNILVLSDGTFSPVQNITGLADNTIYDVRITPNCGGISVIQQYTTTTATTTTSTTAVPTTTTTTAGPNLILSTDLFGTSITDVTGIPAFTLTAPVTLDNGPVYGNHGDFTGTISVSITGTPIIDGNLALERNSLVLQCINIPSSQSGTVVYTFDSISAVTADQLSISANTGTC